MRDYLSDLVLRALRKNSYLTAVDPNEKSDLIVQDVVDDFFSKSVERTVYRLRFSRGSEPDYVLNTPDLRLVHDMMTDARNASLIGATPPFYYRVAKISNWGALITARTSKEVAACFTNLRIETIVTLEFVTKIS